jgi:uncharacterized cupin superfamily protein
MFDIDTVTTPDLDAWGSIADLGAEVLEGDVRASGKMLFGAPTDPLSCAYFACTKGKFRMIYPYTEHALVIEGSATLTDERTGEAKTYHPGDAWFVEKGTPVLWEVHTERFVKNYFGAA